VINPKIQNIITFCTSGYLTATKITSASRKLSHFKLATNCAKLLNCFFKRYVTIASQSRIPTQLRCSSSRINRCLYFLFIRTLVLDLRYFITPISTVITFSLYFKCHYKQQIDLEIP
jgi:hypothetical protein